MNLIQRKIYLYNVTFGLYMLDWWERCLFNVLVIVLIWFVCYNGSRSAAEFYSRMRICMKGFLRLDFEVLGSVSRLFPQRQRCIEILKPVAREANASKL